MDNIIDRAPEIVAALRELDRPHVIAEAKRRGVTIDPTAAWLAAELIEAQAAEIVRLAAEIVRLAAERDAAVRRINTAFDVAWGCDIPHPTIPEYVELHDGMTRVMEALRGSEKEA